MFRIKGNVFKRNYFKVLISNNLNFTENVVKQSTSSSDNSTENRRKHEILFDKSFNKIVGQLTDNEFNRESNELLKANQWFKDVLDYNVLNGKRNRGLVAVLTYDLLAKPEERTEQHMETVLAMGWALELLQAYLLVVDDIMDKSITRRGKPCWYRQVILFNI